MTFTLAGAIAEITAALPKVVWRELPTEEDGVGRTFGGNADDWRFLIIVWVSDTSTRVVGKNNCDGTATKAGLVIRLTPELAKLAGELATKEQ